MHYRVLGIETQMQYFYREKGITTLKNLSILNISSYSDLNLFCVAKIFRTREILYLQYFNVYALISLTF